MPSFSFNKVILIGNITRDLELRSVPSGTAVVTVGLAVNEKFKGGDGELREKTCFIDVTLWGKQAETLCEYAGKGHCILIEGSLELETWDDKDGNKRSKHKVRALHFRFMDNPKSETPDPEPAQDDKGEATPVAAEPDDDSKIPF